MSKEEESLRGMHARGAEGKNRRHAVGVATAAMVGAATAAATAVAAAAAAAAAAAVAAVAAAALPAVGAPPDYSHATHNTADSLAHAAVLVHVGAGGVIRVAPARPVPPVGVSITHGAGLLAGKEEEEEGGESACEGLLHVVHRR